MKTNAKPSTPQAIRLSHACLEILDSIAADLGVETRRGAIELLARRALEAKRRRRARSFRAVVLSDEVH